MGRIRVSTRHDRLLLREFLASALYLDIVLLAALVAIPDRDLPTDNEMVILMLSTAVGLLAAHWFAFRMAAHVTAEGGSWDQHARGEAFAQLLGGLSAALLASLPYLLFDAGTARNLALWVLAAVPAVIGLAIGRVRGRSWFRSSIFAMISLALASAVVFLKVFVH
jgi:hypothetical protein